MLLTDGFKETGSFGDLLSLMNRVSVLGLAGPFIPLLLLTSESQIGKCHRTDKSPHQMLTLPILLSLTS